jgi:superfamily II DNA/RNA helicase
MTSHLHCLDVIIEDLTGTGKTLSYLLVVIIATLLPYRVAHK